MPRAEAIYARHGGTVAALSHAGIAAVEAASAKLAPADRKHDGVRGRKPEPGIARVVERERPLLRQRRHEE